MAQGSASLGEKAFTGGVKQTLSKERIAEIDAAYEDVKSRAERVYNILTNAEYSEYLSRYDILCFCVQYIGMLHIGQLPDDEELAILAPALNRWLNHYHYFYAEEIFGEPEEG